MAWNTSFTRFYSSDLAGLECGAYQKVPRRDRKITKVAVYDGDLEVGQCVAMLRVPAGARIVDAELSWQNGSVTVLAVGDPFACARLSQVIRTSFSRGIIPGTLDCAAYGSCGRLIKTGKLGDGCGLFYQYTCETDILVTNLYSDGNATQGGFPGGGQGTAAVLGAKWTGGRLVLRVEYLEQS